MNIRRLSKWCTVTAVAALGTCFAFASAAYAQRAPADAEQGVQVLTRGPVHEAFAETVTFDPEPGIVAPRPPPEAIEELPPEQKPEGANVAWIPGYWGWDDERNDFLWISGIWRALPPGREWVPGYWGQSRQGPQWTSGYWADAQAREVEYLPEPPATVEAGPNIAAPSADYTWLPGCWVWHQGRYAWRPGFWTEVQPDWVWVPAHYVWAPRGYVFVDGYWDHSVDRRGVLFAPVYFDASVYGRRGFSYSPATVIDLAVFTNHLFLRPNYGHYYFGDYYGSNYSTTGFYPWFSFTSSRFGYDPFYAHRRWQHRRDREWEHGVEADFQRRRDHEEARPPRTWARQRELLTGAVQAREASRPVALSLDELAKSKGSRRVFRPVDKDERQRFTKRGQDIQKFRQERQKLETTAAETPGERPSRTSRPARVTRPKSPVVAPPAERLGKDQAPPRRHAAPRPDPKVEPKPRKAERKPERRTRKAAPADRSKKATPKTSPTVESKEKPKRQSKPKRKAEPKPKAESKPKAEPKDKPRDKDKGDKGKPKKKNQ